MRPDWRYPTQISVWISDFHLKPQHIEVLIDFIPPHRVLAGKSGVHAPRVDVETKRYDLNDLQVVVAMTHQRTDRPSRPTPSWVAGSATSFLRATALDSRTLHTDPAFLTAGSMASKPRAPLPRPTDRPRNPDSRRSEPAAPSLAVGPCPQLEMSYFLGLIHA